MANWTFTNDYLEENINTDLDNNGIIGDGTASNATAPGVNAENYTDGDNYLIAGTLKSVAALEEVKTFLNTFNTNNSITWGSSSSYKYTNVVGSSANLDAASVTDLGNITGTLTVNDSFSAPALLETLQSIKSKAGSATFAYNGIKGTTKELADARSGPYDWITSITEVGGLKHVSFSDLSASPTHLSTLVDGLDPNKYLFEIGGLTYGVSENSFIGVVEGPSLAYRSDATPNGTTSFAEGAQSYISGDYTVTAMGFLNKIPEEEDMAFADFNVAGDDASNNVGLKIHFYEGEQLSHVNISGATVSTTAGYKYTQTAGSGTASVADDIWTLELTLNAGQPAKTTAVSDNTGAEVLGVMINSVSAAKVGGNSDYGGSVFRTNAFWEDIDLMSSEFKFSDLSPGFNINGTNTEEVDFDFFFTKNYLERTFSTDFDAIDGGFAGTALSSVDANNDHTGSYIDVSKPGSLSELRLPVTITDVSATTAGGLTDFYEVAFKNDSWSKANLSMVYGPSINDAPSPAPAPSPIQLDNYLPQPTTTPESFQTVDGFTQFTDADDSLTGQANIKYRMMGGNDLVEVIGGSNYANGNMGEDTIILRGGFGEYLGGKDSDTFEVFAAEEGTSVNGNRGEDTITGSVSGVTYRGGKDNDTLAVSQGEAWGDLGVDVFRGVTGEGYAVIQDYTIGEDIVELTMDGNWSNIDSGLMFTDTSGDQVMLLIGINDVEQVKLV